MYSPVIVAGGPDAVLSHTPHIASVCAHWRAILIHTPVFWAAINASITTPGQHCLSLLRLFLQRSQNTPLSIEIRAWAPDPINGDVVQALMDESHRWKRLMVPTGSASSLDFISSIPDGKLPLLESIKFNGRAVAVGKIVDAPMLNSVFFQTIVEIDDVAHLPHRQIQNLSVELRNGEVCRPVLAIFSRLTHLTIGVVSSIDWQGLPTPNPTSYVRTLTLLGRGNAAVSALELFNGMNFPNLERLELIGCSAWDLPSLESHATRSGCQIKTLILDYGLASGPDVLQLLRSLPMLETLDVSVASFPTFVLDLLLAWLTPGDAESGGVGLPALRTIAIAGKYDFPTAALLNMLEARLSAGSGCSPLDVIDIVLSDRAVATPDLERFAALRTAGIASLVSLDENNDWVRISNGRWLR
ncbi:hypothetical protein C8R47DRAFT_1164557 [Mycena vitilis]|nr:hypothetical protein C8R47DRAFT_1164557 [Mycena vitilis]